MDVRDIETMVLIHEDDIEKELRGDILTKAYEEFGYKADSFGSRGPLAKVLSELEIASLNTDQVEKYKASKKYSLTIKTWPFYVMSLLALDVTYWSIASRYLGGKASDNLMVALIGGGIALSVATLICGVVFGDEMPTYSRNRDWVRFSFGKQSRSYDGYSRYIPVHILNMAVQIKSKLPDATFYVDELTVSSKTTWPEPDPFISVEYGSEKYYFGVWDEREFEAKA